MVQYDIPTAGRSEDRRTFIGVLRNGREVFVIAFLGLIFALAGAAIGGLVAGGWRPADATRPASTPIEPDVDVTPFLVDRDNLPDIYTGELVDIDGDGSAEFIMFGDPAAPLVERVTPPSSGRVTAAWVGVVGVGLTALITLVVTFGPKLRRSNDEAAQQPPAET